MQLDKTRIVVRERTHVELIDLTFHVLRAHASSLVKVGLLGILPFLVLNFMLIGWIATPASEDVIWEDYAANNARYYYDMVLLVFLQAPLATALITIYLGQAVFLARPTVRQVLADLRSSWQQLLLTQGLLRLVLPGTLLLVFIAGTDEFQPGTEFVVFGLLCLVAAFTRAVRPYLPEIVLLEKNPLVSRGTDTVTVAKRSSRLHAAGAGSGDILSRWLASCLVNAILVYMVYQSALFLQGVFANHWEFATPWMLYVAFPLSLWFAAGFTATCRFLSYLDARIRNEGWEVELLLRAEGARLRESPTAG